MLSCKLKGHEWHAKERSNIIQQDIMGYCLRLYNCECSRCKTTKQMWIYSFKSKIDKICEWTKDDYLPVPTDFIKGELW